jgi:hypothetical protein
MEQTIIKSLEAVTVAIIQAIQIVLVAKIASGRTKNTPAAEQQAIPHAMPLSPIATPRRVRSEIRFLLLSALLSAIVAIGYVLRPGSLSRLDVLLIAVTVSGMYSVIVFAAVLVLNDRVHGVLSSLIDYLRRQ